ncbi:RNA polymerase sigma factor [Xylanimonas oleitrophica]|nr:sigma-70 family RNA polymerase sigma factor [Xylanimonas oleitrophica]
MFRATYPAVLAFLARRVDPHDAEDLAAEVFAIAWDGWGRIPLDEMRPWLFGVARTLTASSRRSRDRHRRLELRVENDRPVERDETSLTDTTLDLRRAWARLSATDQEVLSLVAWDGMTGREAAQVLGCTRAAFSIRLTRARRRLKRLLDAKEAVLEPGSEAVIRHSTSVLAERSKS